MKTIIKKAYRLYNTNDNESYRLSFKNKDQALKFVVQNLDLNKTWRIKPVEYKEILFNQLKY
tara:strand:+ start:21734 stop:21919 length:186 start_codon:yes stop_codon:yes gene_type:complete